MAQSNAAHEPSMEEILASIRRIIETTDGSDDENPGEPEEARRPVIEPSDDSVLNRVRESVANSQDNGPKPTDRVLDGRMPGSVGQTPLRGSISQTAVERSNVGGPEGLKPETGTKEPGSVSLAEVAARANASVEKAPSSNSPVSVSTLSDDRVRAHPDTTHRTEATEPKSPMLPTGPTTVRNRAQALVSSETGNRISASFDHLNKAVSSGPPRSFDEIAEEMLRPLLQEWLEDNLPMLVERLVREEIERLARGA
jgi:uncharacterized protein